MTRPSDLALDLCFAALESAAVNNQRCPLNRTAGGPSEVCSAYISELARLGRIRVDISGQNYRAVKLLAGPHAGKSTLPHPDGHPTWKIVGIITTINGKPWDAAEYRRRREERWGHRRTA